MNAATTTSVRTILKTVIMNTFTFREAAALLRCWMALSALPPLLPDLTNAETSIGRDNEIEPKAGAITPAELILAIAVGRAVVLSLRYLLRV